MLHVLKPTTLYSGPTVYVPWSSHHSPSLAVTNKPSIACVVFILSITVYPSTRALRPLCSCILIVLRYVFVPLAACQILMLPIWVMELSHLTTPMPPLSVIYIIERKPVEVSDSFHMMPTSNPSFYCPSLAANASGWAPSVCQHCTLPHHRCLFMICHKHK
jgi:hypothetical protein